MPRWYGDKRTTVEECRTLSVSAFARQGYLCRGAGGSVRWSRGGREVSALAWYCDGAALWLDYAVPELDGTRTPYRSPCAL